jgi:hypothetical protein
VRTRLSISPAMQAALPPHRPLARFARSGAGARGEKNPLFGSHRCANDAQRSSAFTSISIVYMEECCQSPLRPAASDPFATLKQGRKIRLNKGTLRYRQYDRRLLAADRAQSTNLGRQRRDSGSQHGNALKGSSRKPRAVTRLTMRATTMRTIRVTALGSGNEVDARHAGAGVTDEQGDADCQTASHTIKRHSDGGA